jgi:aspartate kinase
MALIVQKYGGTSVADPNRLRAVAERIAVARRAGHDLVVVVSAMGQTTDELLALAHQVARAPSGRELDMLLTVGERVSMSLLAMALQDLGTAAISFTGSQSGILTSDHHRTARITDIRPDRIRAELDRRRVVIVAGFQGVNPTSREITTLGRGGSDTTAVALAAALDAAACEILTDVRGVMTADPRIVSSARVIANISYRLCSTVAHLGGRVLHPRSVDLAARHRVPVIVKSSFEEHAGTRVFEENGGAAMEPLEGATVTAIAHQADVSIAIAEGNAGGKGEARSIIASVAGTLPEMDLIAHEQQGSAHHALIWVGTREDAELLKSRFNELRGPGMEWRLEVEHGCGFVSLVGLGLGGAEAAKAEEALERASITVIALRATPTALVFRVAGERTDDAVRALHETFLPANRPV